MSRTVFGRVVMEEEGLVYPGTEATISKSGWVYVDEAGNWFPPHRIRYIDPSDEKPERH